MRVIDLFCGCGGMSLGFDSCGTHVIKAVEFDPMIAETYKHNFSDTDVIVGDIQKVDKSGVFHRGDAEIIIGGPPCQGFSMEGARSKRGFIDDPRNYLFRNYFNVVHTVRPEMFFMENVKGLATIHNGAVFDEIRHVFTDPDLWDGHPYTLYCPVLNAIHFQTPQKRERLIIIGVQNSETDFPGLFETAYDKMRKLYSGCWESSLTVRNAIGNLPEPVESEDEPVTVSDKMSRYECRLSYTGPVYNHTRFHYTEKSIERMSRIKCGENYTVLDENIKSIHSGSYGRLVWDKPAPTITTRFDTPSGGRFIHPSENRTITPREAARLQGFPDWFRFYGNKTSVCKQIGNAIPVGLSCFLSRFAVAYSELEG